MACCALKKQKKHWMVLPLLLFLTVGTIGGIIIIVQSLSGLMSPRIKRKRNKSLNTYKELMKGLTNKILHEPFIFNAAFRCKISGRLMKLSTPVAGFVYKYFNLGILAVTVLSLYLVWLGIAAFKI